MRRIAFFLATVGFLSSCSMLQKRVTYDLTFNVKSDAVREELVWSSLRQIERAAEQWKITLTDKEVQTGSGGTSITVTLRNAKEVTALTEQLTEPFELRFMREVPAGQGGMAVEGHGNFEETGLGGQDLFWAEAADDTVEGKGSVRLLFTKEGYERLRTLISQNRAKTIGLFVQGKLVSKLMADQIKQDIVIRGIPSSDLARSFADLVNVGLHVTFAPAP